MTFLALYAMLLYTFCIATSICWRENKLSIKHIDKMENSVHQRLHCYCQQWGTFLLATSLTYSCSRLYNANID